MISFTGIEGDIASPSAKKIGKMSFDVGAVRLDVGDQAEQQE
ncbi:MULTISPECIES: hypothetical protein [unclassified Bradyrhizobium]|nr:MULTISPECIES: hypothetical protein [unclassified Bradyrhizobium]